MPLSLLRAIPVLRAGRSERPLTSAIRSFLLRIASDRSLYGALAFAETAESLRLCRLALRPEPKDRIVGIGSSGDVLLSFAGHGAGEVIGFDHNPAQTALAALKRAVIRHHSVSEYRAFFGVDPLDPARRRALYAGIQAGLDPEHRRRLEADPRWIAEGPLNRGMTYLIIRAVSALLLKLAGAEAFAVFAGEVGTAAERRAQLDRVMRSVLVRRGITPLLQRQAWALKWLFFPHQICRVSSRPEEMIADFFGTFAPLLVGGARANPVLSRAVTGVLHPEWTSELYRPAIFERIAGQRGRFELTTVSLTEGLRRLPKGWATKVYLSNAPDYFASEALAELGSELRRVAAPGARVLYFSLLDLDRLGPHLGPLLPEEELAALRALDNVHLYPSIVVRTMGGCA